jgi:hypothetical protein
MKGGMRAQSSMSERVVKRKKEYGVKEILSLLVNLGGNPSPPKPNRHKLSLDIECELLS